MKAKTSSWLRYVLGGALFLAALFVIYRALTLIPCDTTLVSVGATLAVVSFVLIIVGDRILEITGTGIKLQTITSELKESGDEIKKSGEEVLKTISAYFGIIKKSYEIGIVGVFGGRKLDPALHDEIRQSILDSQFPVLMMGISLRDYFMNGAEYSRTIIDALNKGVTFQLLILDPTSESAKERAVIEQGFAVSGRSYVDSQLFKDISNVTDWLYKPLHHEVGVNEKIKRQIDARFSTYGPTAFLIKTDKYVFVEQYHIGNLDSIKSDLDKRDRDILCLGGYVPILQLGIFSPFAKLLESHFRNMWMLMKDNTLDTTYKRIEDFIAKQKQS